MARRKCHDHITLDFENMAQMDSALYRDFPDPARVRAQEKF